jgi:hypothetical protein
MRKSLILAVFLFSSFTAFAEEVQFLESVPNDIIETIFKEIDIPLKVTGEVDPTGRLATHTFTIRGYNAMIFTNNTTYIALRTNYTPVKDFPLEKMDKWNEDMWATVFTSRKGNPWVRMDIVLDGGISKENLKSQINKFIDKSRNFADFIGKKD